ncbi:MAG: LuxR C-terminal-related transcriptional regulator [Anaerolineales bacterium]
MSTPILTTKFFIPPTRKELVQRQRLLNRLSQGIERKLTLVSGPAGFGKTTLLSAWVAELQRPVGWISLDAADNDWSSFVAFLIKGLQKISAGIANDIVEMLYSAKTQESDALITYLINQIAEIQTPFLLVLDDYHVITDTRIHDLLQLILENQPAQMHLVISTRSDPPWPLARWRARGELSEMRTQHLRFNLEETAIFLNETMGLGLSRQNVEQLEARIEGWAAGLQMAALSLKDREDVPGFIQVFTGSHRFVFDYLVDEVFRGLSTEIQDFLLTTSILDRMCAQLCDHIRGASDSQDILEQLEQMNLFVIPLDGHRCWYRYHHLFAELIQQISRQKFSRQMPELHRKAREWYQQNGLVSEAIHHGVAEGNFEQVADLIEKDFIATLEKRDRIALIRWLETLPAGVIQSRPWLSLASAYVLLPTGLTQEVARLLQQAESSIKQLATPEAEHIRSYIAYVQAELKARSADMAATIAYARKSLEYLPPEDKRLRCSAASILGTALQRSGAFEDAGQAFIDGIAAGRTIGDSNAVISLYGDLIGLFVEQSKLHQAYAYCQEALQFIEASFQKRGRYTPGAAYIHFRLSTILRHWNDLEGSLHHAQISNEILRKWGLQYRLNFINLAIAQHAVGAYAEAHRVLSVAEQVAQKQSAYWIDDVKATRVSFWLAEGNLVAASQWALERKLDTERDLSYQNQLVYRTLAHVRVVQGQGGDENALDEAVRLLAGLEMIYQNSGAIAYLLQTFILQALAFQASGKLNQALKSLGKALSLGEGGGYLRAFIREGEPMEKLLRNAVARGNGTPYIEELLRGLESQRKRSSASRSSLLIDPLTDRERDVLRCLETSMTVPEMATSLVISIETVRTHIKRIYRKLDVHSRFEAITKAKKLNLF